MATMKTLNGYGFNATELNGKAASDYLQKTDTATNSTKLGGKAPEYYIQPRNLLDNSDFRNPVNQRGNSEYAFNFGYSLDRWRLYGGDAISRVRVLSGCIELSLNDNKSYFDQLIDVDKTKTYTFAVLADDGLHVISGIPSVGANDGVILLGVNSAGYVKASVVGFLRIYNIYWAALYEGSYTADTLPPYVPKGYASELAECQRYFWLCDNSYFSEGCGYVFAPNECRFMISTPQTMRISPSIIADKNNTTSYGIKLVINGNVLTPTSVSVRRANNRLCLTLGGKFTTNAVGVMRIESQLSFSADL